MVVNGEESDGSYFKILADYIHLNPVRSGWLGGGTGKRLKSWKWSSFPTYAGGKRPDWLKSARGMRAFRLSDDGHDLRFARRMISALETASRSAKRSKALHAPASSGMVFTP